MYDGWLWLSILKIAAWPSPISTTPAFSPGPQITCGPVVGSFFRWIREDLHEQCSDNMTEKMPSSVRLGSRPMACSTRSYSSVDWPCWATISAVIWLMAAAHSGGEEIRHPDRREAALFFSPLPEREGTGVGCERSEPSQATAWRARRQPPHTRRRP